MKGTSLLALQIGVITRLRTTLAVTALCPATSILDHVPEPPPWPRAVYDEPAESPAPFFGQDAFDAIFSIVVATRDGQTTKSGIGVGGYGPALEIATEIVKALTDLATPITVTGFDVVDVQTVSIDCRRSEAGDREVELLFRADLEDAS